jgi:hypothetical protein
VINLIRREQLISDQSTMLAVQHPKVLVRYTLAARPRTNMSYNHLPSPCRWMQV